MWEFRTYLCAVFLCQHCAAVLYSLLTTVSTAAVLYTLLTIVSNVQRYCTVHPADHCQHCAAVLRR